MQNKKIIYVAGPYTGPDYDTIEKNIGKAEKAAIELWSRGWVVITPHLNTAHFEIYEDKYNLDYHTWLNGDLEILSRCDAIFFLDGWDDSKGSMAEYSYCDANGLDIYYQKDGYPDYED
jgi:hypothetical protein